MFLLRRFALAALLAAAFCAAAAEAPRVEAPARPPQRMLFVGNSLRPSRGGVPTHLRALAQAGDKWNAGYYEAKAITVPGAFLFQHEDALAETLGNGLPWDIVVLQGESTEPMGTDPAKARRFQAAVRGLDQRIRDARSRTVLFMTWAYRGKPEMGPLLTEAYVNAGAEAGALVVPVGLAFRRAVSETPPIAVHESDARHPTLEGTYLAACTFYAALYRKSPEGVPYLGGLRKEAAATLQRLAWETVKEFYGW